MPDFLLTLLLAFLPACETDDDRNCQWNAQVQGDGQGDSYVDFMGGIAWL